MRRFLTMKPWHRKTTCFLVALGLLTFLGPFGTYADMTLFGRLVFWTVTLAGIGALVHFAVQLFLELGFLQQVARPLRITLGAAVGAIPGVAVVAFAERVMRPPGMTLDLAQFAQLWMQVALISMVIALVEYWRTDDGEVEHAKGAAAPAGRAQTAFHARLPLSEGGPEDIISLSMQDHYVEVTTTTGRHLVLVRLSDAIRELDGLDGLQVHRSHWVARGHLRGIRTKGHRSWADLSDGREVSISKSYLDAVQAVLTR